MKICSAEGCDHPLYSYGLCNIHYQRMRCNGTLDKTTREICTVEGCTRKHLAKGLCSAHYQRMRSHGSLQSLTNRGIPLINRILSRISKDENGCWLYTGKLTKKGYAHIRDEDSHRMVFAHRAIYEHFVGLIPDGKEIDHKCRNRACVNPKHLEPVTHLENIQRAVPHNVWGMAQLAHDQQYAQAKRAADIRWGNLLVEDKGII